MSGKILINYRRGDDPGFAGRIFDRLEEAFASDQLFMDIDGIERGVDSERVLEEQIGKCDIFLAVIGPNWLDARDEKGNRRLDNPNDLVRMAIEAALKLGKRIIPVLINDAAMPHAERLPESLKPLVRRNAVRLTHERFRADAQGLVKQLEKALKSAEAARQAGSKTAVDNLTAGRKAERAATGSRRRVQAVVGLALLLTVAGVVWLNQVYRKKQDTQDTSVVAMGPLTPLTAAQERALNPKDEFKECAISCPRMVVVPAGKFMMGSPEREGEDDEQPQHEVTLAKPFAVGKYEVTFAEWDACVAAGGCPAVPDGGWGRGPQPAINVSGNDAQQYVTWLSKITGKTYRLLTEAEWEYAARAGTTTAYSFGDDEAALGEFAWYHANSDDKTRPVGEKKPNSFGLNDMHGNVWEWVEDTWHKNYDGAPSEGVAWLGGPKIQVIRGGSWENTYQALRSAYRHRLPIYNTGSNRLGFRVGRTLTP